VLRSTTTGISAVIDARGVVRRHLGHLDGGRIDGVIPPAAAPTLFVVVSCGGLLRTQGGRDFLLVRINTILPAGATLTWDSVQGTMSGPLEIRGIHYRDGETRLDAARLRADYALWPLTSRRIAINTLELDGVVLQLPRDDSPFELPRWPEVLPTLDMPVKITVQDLRVRDLRVVRVLPGDGEVGGAVEASALRAGADLSDCIGAVRARPRYWLAEIRWRANRPRQPTQPRAARARWTSI